MMQQLTLACGPYFSPAGLVVSAAVFLLVKPAVYYAFIQAFRYRVSRPIPMTVRQAVKLTAARAGLGLVLVGGGALVVYFSQSTLLTQVSWIYLYLARALAWFVVGYYGAVLRGRRLVGWVISGTLINVAFDAVFVTGALGEWFVFLLIMGALAVFIYLLHVVGRRASLQARFTDAPRCAGCEYNLTGNLSGRCPECGLEIADAAAGD